MLPDGGRVTDRIGPRPYCAAISAIASNSAPVTPEVSHRRAPCRDDVDDDGRMDVHFVGIDGLPDALGVVVVVDVMRAFTVAAQCFAQGADKIVFAASLEEAVALKERHPGWVAIKDGPPASGFDSVNSPGLLRSLDVAGRTVVQKTTAGTVGALAVRTASLLFCASFVVAEATAQLLRRHAIDGVTFVVPGGAEEDLACAHYIARRASESGTDAAVFLDRAAHSRAAADLAEGVRRGFPGVHSDDVALCLEIDRFPFAMVATSEESGLVLRPRW